MHPLILLTEIIKLIDFDKDLNQPSKKFQELYIKALDKKQPNCNAACVATCNKETLRVTSRFVNIKYISKNKYIFFSNYNSRKALDISSNKNVSCVFFWPSINTQIRIEGNINKSPESFSDTHFNKRSHEKNSLAISSYQSSEVDSYNTVIKNYKHIYNSYDQETKRPQYWGGYEIIPNYFEFWEGNINRLNKREVHKISDSGDWEISYLQP